MRGERDQHYRVDVTDALLITLIAVFVALGAGALVFAVRTRAVLDRRLKRLERRMDDLLSRPAPTLRQASQPASGPMNR